MTNEDAKKLIAASQTLDRLEADMEIIYKNAQEAQQTTDSTLEDSKNDLVKMQENPDHPKAGK